MSQSNLRTSQLKVTFTYLIPHTRYSMNWARWNTRNVCEIEGSNGDKHQGTVLRVFMPYRLDKVTNFPEEPAVPHSAQKGRRLFYPEGWGYMFLWTLAPASLPCMYVPAHLSVCLSIYLSVYLSIYLSICLSHILRVCVAYERGFEFDDRIDWTFIQLVTAFHKSLSSTDPLDFWPHYTNPVLSRDCLAGLGFWFYSLGSDLTENTSIA
jgi:hypothetical protein